MVCAETRTAAGQRSRAFLCKWRLKCKSVADSLQEAGDRLFTFTRLGPWQWRSARTTNVIKRLCEAFRCWIKIQAVLPDTEPRPIVLVTIVRLPGPNRRNRPGGLLGTRSTGSLLRLRTQISWYICQLWDHTNSTSLFPVPAIAVVSTVTGRRVGK